MARKFSVAAAIFVIAITLRLMNAGQVFVEGIPRLAPVDALYHWKRISWSAAHFPRVLEFDGDRGERGAFCPWPPLYDLSAAAVARLFGARTPAAVLLRIVWIPPLVAAFFIAAAAWFVARHFGSLGGAAVGIALAASPFLVAESSIGDIDHHYLEWPLTLAIIGAIAVALHGRAVLAGVLLALSMVAAMFIQTALLIACGIAFVVLFATTNGAAAAIGFSAASLAIAIYRLTRPQGYPDNPWFLGWPHAALFAAAAVASAYLFFRRQRGPALLFGMGAVFAFPSAPASILEGAHFFGGERWLETINEFQPMLRGHANDLASDIASLSAGVVLVWILAALAIRHRDYLRGTIALYAIVYLLLAISSRRFGSIGIPLLALAGAVTAASIADRGRAIVAAVAVALIPVLQLALWVQHPQPPIDAQQMPWIRTAVFLQRPPRVGRVLAPWSLGHVLEVIGERGVIIDNFGTMPDRTVFDRANDALLARDERALARYCDEAGVRYIVIDNPLYGLSGVSWAIGMDRSALIKIDSEGRPVSVSRLAQATWWWRAYFNYGAAIPQQAMFGRPFTRFRLVYADPQPSWSGTPMYRGPALMVWEYSAHVR